MDTNWVQDRHYIAKEVTIAALWDYFFWHIHFNNIIASNILLYGNFAYEFESGLHCCDKEGGGNLGEKDANWLSKEIKNGPKIKIEFNIRGFQTY